MTRIINQFKKIYRFYEVNLAFLLMLLFLDSIVIGIAALVPYLNWFLDSLPLVVIAFDWVVILVWFRPKIRIIFSMLLGLIGLMLLMELVSFERFLRQIGVLALVLILTIVIKQVIATNARDEE